MALTFFFFLTYTGQMGLFWYLTVVKILWVIFFKTFFYSLIGYITLLKLTRVLTGVFRES